MARITSGVQRPSPIQNDFDKRRKQIDRLISMIFIVTLLMIFGAALASVYLLVNPEVIGQFVGNVAQGVSEGYAD